MELDVPPCPTEGCKESPKPLAVHGNIEASEWYFPRCHRSVAMAPEAAIELLHMEDSRRKRE